MADFIKVTASFNNTWFVGGFERFTNGNTIHSFFYIMLTFDICGIELEEPTNSPIDTLRKVRKVLET